MIEVSAEFLVLLVSPFIGSFLGCVADRLPQGRSIIAGRSSCDHCGHVLGMRDLVPVISWLIFGARCRYCSHKISPYYPAVEFAALAVSLSAVLATSGPVEWISIALGWVLITLAAMDLRHLVLSDVLTVGLMGAGLIVASYWSQFPFIDHVIGALLGGAALYGLNLVYRSLRHRDGLGMGDVKLLAAAGAWVAWPNLPTVLLYATFSALIVVLARHLLARRATHGMIPFGAYICLGLWLTWLYGPLNIWSI